MKEERKSLREKFKHQKYAHRGFYQKDQSIPENSLPAFQRAVEMCYGIELDVQFSKDKKVVVFHDDDLERMCGRKARVDSLTYDELQELSLKGTEYRIPLFTEVLKVLEKGRGPLIVELKTGSDNDLLCEKTYEILKTYPGTYCIESFNPMMVNWFRKNAPEVIRGQLATKKEDYKNYPAMVSSLLSNARFSFWNRPDFIAYNIDAKRPSHVLQMRKKGVLLIGWTSRDSFSGKEDDAVIFEHYKA